MSLLYWKWVFLEWRRKRTPAFQFATSSCGWLLHIDHPKHRNSYYTNAFPGWFKLILLPRPLNLGSPTKTSFENIFKLIDCCIVSHVVGESKDGDEEMFSFCEGKERIWNFIYSQDWTHPSHSHRGLVFHPPCLFWRSKVNSKQDYYYSVNYKLIWNWVLWGSLLYGV